MKPKYDIERKIFWECYKNKLPAEIVEQWVQLAKNSAGSSASSYANFSINSKKLIDSNTFYYAVAFYQDKVVCVVPFSMFERKFFLFRFKQLHNIDHNQLDLFTAAGQNEIDSAFLVNSLVSALRVQIDSWHQLVVSNWFLNHKSKSLYFKFDYRRYSGYYAIEHAKSVSDIIPKKLLKNIARNEKKLEKAHTNVKLIKVDNPEQINSALNVFYQIEKSGWKGQNNTAIACDENIRSFYDKTWNEFASYGNACVFVLSAEGKPIASAIAFIHGENLYLHKIAFLETYNSFGAGSILIKQIIKDAIDNQKIQLISFVTDPEWLKRWHTKKHKLYAVEAFNNNIASKILSFFLNIMRAL